MLYSIKELEADIIKMEEIMNKIKAIQEESKKERKLMDDSIDRLINKLH